ncbi:MAG: transporter [Gemmatales bacterium]|nr:MAG: transporter [Gemmatales bacterium]
MTQISAILLAFGESGHSAPQSVPAMVTLGCIMVATYLAIAFEWLHKSLAAMLGAIFAIIAAMYFGLFLDEAKDVHEIIGEDLGVIGVIVGTSILVDIVGRSGLFHFLAIKIVKQTGGDPVRLLFFLVLATMAFVTFLTIAPGTLIMVSLTLVVTKELDLDPKPYILAVALAANSAALMTFASGICTLMLGTAGRLPYVDFFRVTTPMAILSVVVVYFVIRKRYAPLLVTHGDVDERQKKVDGFDEWALVKDRRLFIRSAIILGGTIVGFALAESLRVGMDFIAFCGGTAALLFSGIYPDEAIKKVNWTVILFFVGLFVIIGAVRESGLLTVLAHNMVAVFGGNPTLLMMVMAIFVLVLSGIVDNIPVAATLIPIVRAMGEQGVAVNPLWWTLIIASNLGGNSTPVGSVSTVIALHALEKERHSTVSWGEFLRLGGAILGIQTVLVLVYLFAFQKFNLFP